MKICARQTRKMNDCGEHPKKKELTTTEKPGERDRGICNSARLQRRFGRKKGKTCASIRCRTTHGCAASRTTAVIRGALDARLASSDRVPDHTSCNPVQI